MTRMDELALPGLRPFPEKNGPVVWPQYSIRDALAPEQKHEQCAGSA
jgi:hypothetical protein